MKKALLFFSGLLISAGLFTGCGKILMMTYGVHQPRVESSHDILKAANRWGVDTSGLVVVARAEAWPRVYKSFDGLPEALVFDNTGRCLQYKAFDTMDCNAGVFSFVPALRKDSAYRAISRASLDTLKAYLVTLEGKPLSSVLDPAADYYLFANWAAWAGRLNKDKVAAWQELARQNGFVRIQTIPVNIDFLERWDATARDTLIARLERRNRKS